MRSALPQAEGLGHQALQLWWHRHLACAAREAPFEMASAAAIITARLLRSRALRHGPRTTRLPATAQTAGVGCIHEGRLRTGKGGRLKRKRQNYCQRVARAGYRRAAAIQRALVIRHGPTSS